MRADMTTAVVVPNPTPLGLLSPRRDGMLEQYQRQIVNRHKTARGHLDAVVRMVEDDAYCPDVMKQLSAVKDLLEPASRLALRNHLETCVSRAMQEGRTEKTGEVVS